MKLNLGGKQEGGKDHHDEASQLHDRVELIFEFNNGHETQKRNASVGESVAQVKKFISDNFGIAYAKLTLQVEGKTMIDPLSLNDFKSIVGKKEVVIKVLVAP